MRQNIIQFYLHDDPGRVLINAYRIRRGIDWKHANKLFSKVIWRKEHKCNCSIHQKILKRMKLGQEYLLKEIIEEVENGRSLDNKDKPKRSGRKGNRRKMQRNKK